MAITAIFGHPREIPEVVLPFFFSSITFFILTLNNNYKVIRTLLIPFVKTRSHYGYLETFRSSHQFLEVPQKEV